MNREQLAKVCHEINRAYCIALGDYSQPEWKDAPQSIKDSSRDGVAFHLANPEAGPEGSHNNWYDFKLKQGWVYGPLKVPALKEHPCMVPFGSLPVEQQAKDYIFRAIVHALKPFLTEK